MKLKLRLKEIMKQKHKRGFSSPLTDSEVTEIRRAFFEFFVGVFQRFTEKQYWQTTTTKGSMAIDDVSKRFDINLFIEETRLDQKEFLKQFCRLQMFTRLLEKKVWPLKNEDMVDLLFLEENIRLKLSRYLKNIKKVSLTFFRNNIWDIES